MKSFNTWSIVLTAVVAAITLYNQFVNSLTYEIMLPIWLFLILLLFPFLGFTLYCYCISKCHRRFKSGDTVYLLNDNTPFTVLDYDRYRPRVIVLQRSVAHISLSTPPFIRIDFKMHEKHLYKQDHLSPSERFNEYCREKGIHNIDSTLNRM